MLADLSRFPVTGGRRKLTMESVEPKTCGKASEVLDCFA
jgi:hypothetical protein